MRVRPLAGLLAVLTAVGAAQVLESTVWLPDSLGGLVHPRCLAYFPELNELYVGGEAGECVVVIDPATLAKKARIPAGAFVRDIIYNPAANKVYSANEDDSTVTIIDASTHDVLRQLGVFGWPYALTCNPVHSKVYCARRGRFGQWDSMVVVIYGANDSIRCEVFTDRYPAALWYDSLDNQVYCGTWRSESLNIIEGIQDYVTGWIPVWCRIDKWAPNPKTRKLYLASDDGGKTICVVDVDRDTWIATMTASEIQSDICADTALNRVYWTVPRHSELWFADGSADTVLAVHPTGGEAAAVCARTGHDRVYCANALDGSVTVASLNGVDTVIEVGAWPHEMCYAPGVDRVFCANRGSHDMTVLDAAVDTTLATVPFGDRPRALLYDSLSDRLLCTNYFTGLVTGIDGASSRTDFLIRAGDAPAGLWLHPGLARAYVACEESACLSVLDVPGREVLATVAAGSGPGAVCGSATQGKVYCANYGLWPDQDSTVTVVDAGSNGVLATLEVGNRPIDIVTGPSEAKVYCASYGASSVAVIDVAGDSVAAVVTTERWPRALCFGDRGSKLYCACEWPGSVAVIDAHTDTVLATVSVGSQPYSLCYAPAGNEVYVANRWSGDVSVLDCAGDTVVATIDVESLPVAVVYDATHDAVYCANSGSDDVTVIDCASHSVAAILGCGADPYYVAWNRAHSRVYVANRRGSGISVFRTDSVPGVAEARPKGRAQRPRATIARSTTRLPEGQAAQLLDITGRKVMELQPGLNDIRHVAPGVYFIHTKAEGGRVKAEQDTGVRKVVIQR